jgi:hypothetical protein
MEVNAVCVDIPMTSDLVEPGCVGDGNVGVDDYVFASPGTHIDGQPGSPGFSPPPRSRSNTVHCLGCM